MAGCCCSEACTAAVLIGVMRLPACDSAWCLVCEVCRLTVDCVTACRCFLSFVFLGGARRLELSPCNTILCFALATHPGAAFHACSVSEGRSSVAQLLHRTQATEEAGPGTEDLKHACGGAG